MRIPLSRGQFALIDDCDAPIVAAFSWYASPNKMGGYYAVCGGKAADGSRATIYMHRVIVGAPQGRVVDHVNHDTLDNRRSNLCVGSQKDNMQNGKRALTTACPKGHLYDQANTYINKKGGRICRACNRERVAAIYAAETPEQKALRLTKCGARYRANHDECRAKQNAYAAAHRKEKHAYDRAYRPIKNARRRAISDGSLKPLLQ